MDLLNVKLNITIPYGKPNKNGITYTEEAIKSAVSKLSKNLPIVSKSGLNSNVIGHTTGEYHLNKDVEGQTYHIVVNGILYNGEIEGVFYECDGNKVKDFEFIAFNFDLK